MFTTANMFLTYYWKGIRIYMSTLCS